MHNGMALSQTLVARSAVAGAISSSQSAAANVCSKQVVAAAVPLDFSSSRQVSGSKLSVPKAASLPRSRQRDVSYIVRATADTTSEASTRQGKSCGRFNRFVSHARI